MFLLLKYCFFPRNDKMKLVTVNVRIVAMFPMSPRIRLESGERSVSTLDFLCLPCFIRDIRFCFTYVAVDKNNKKSVFSIQLATSFNQRSLDSSSHH